MDDGLGVGAQEVRCEQTTVSVHQDDAGKAPGAGQKGADYRMASTGTPGALTDEDAKCVVGGAAERGEILRDGLNLGGKSAKTKESGRKRDKGDDNENPDDVIERTDDGANVVPIDRVRNEHLDLLHCKRGGRIEKGGQNSGVDEAQQENVGY